MKVRRDITEVWLELKNPWFNPTATHPIQTQCHFGNSDKLYMSVEEVT